MCVGEGGRVRERDGKKESELLNGGLKQNRDVEMWGKRIFLPLALVLLSLLLYTSVGKCVIFITLNV